MKSLDELKKEQPQILLAELAGLLHNIGKLDPNFLSSVVSEGGSKLEVRNQGQEIDQYGYSRFAVFDSNLLANDIKAIVQSQAQWSDRSTFLNANNCFNEIESQLKRKAFSQWDAVEISLFIQEIRNANPTTIDPKKITGRMPFQKGRIDALLDAVVYRSKNGPLSPILNPRNSTNEDALRQQWESALRGQKIKVANMDWPFADLLTVFWDSPFFFKEGRDDYKRLSTLDVWMKDDLNNRLPALLALSHGEVSGSEKQSVTCQPKWPDLFHSTAFGFEKSKIDIWSLASMRQDVITHLVNGFSAPLIDFAALRESFTGKARIALKEGVGDTQWPINEITLWDYAGSIATLFKSAVAKAVLEDRMPTVGEVKWRLLSIRYDGLEYLSRAHHISDLLARRDTLEAALNAVKTVIEVEYPLGNEIYRDENGSVLLVPDVRDGDQQIDLLKQECGTAGTLDDLLLRRFSETSYGKEEDDRSPLGGEVKPIIALSDERLGKQIKLTEAPGWSHPTLQANPKDVQSWWSDERKHGEICTVCRLRPQGFGAPDGRHPKNNHKGWKLHLEEEHHRNKQPLDCEVCKAIDRQVCWVCLERRDDRSKKWMNNADGSLKRTIWTDEVADSNGRLALVVGRFVLDGWLDGTLIPTMQKSASFARIQRCWRTTQEFWQDVEKNLPELVGEDTGSRLKLTPENPAADKLGPSHVYDLELNGRHLSVVWTGDHFITADNLEYFSQTAGLGKEPDWETLLEEKSFSVYEPSAHLSRRKNKAQVTIRKDGVEHGERYSPFIPILAQASLFMALVPANKAMEVAKHIKCKYETEMGRVRDRLPLHLGLVFAPRRTPVHALLEAGRRMLEIPDVWTEWEVESVSHNTQHHIAFKHNSVKWHIPAVMGDGATPDQWYPHLMSREPGKGEDLTKATPSPWKHAKDLQPGDKVYVRPSRFDYEFLDTTGRRFELNYDEAGVRVVPVNRLHPATRPFLLEEIADLETVWEALKKLPGGQRDFLVRLIETKRTEWRVRKSDVSDEAYKILERFASDTLRRTDKEQKWWTAKLDNEQRRLLEAWAANGKLADALELYEKMMKLEIE